MAMWPFVTQKQYKITWPWPQITIVYNTKTIQNHGHTTQKQYKITHGHTTQKQYKITHGHTTQKQYKIMAIQHKNNTKTTWPYNTKTIQKPHGHTTQKQYKNTHGHTTQKQYKNTHGHTTQKQYKNHMAIQRIQNQQWPYNILWPYNTKTIVEQNEPWMRFTWLIQHKNNFVQNSFLGWPYNTKTIQNYFGRYIHKNNTKSSHKMAIQHKNNTKFCSAKYNTKTIFQPRKSSHGHTTQKQYKITHMAISTQKQYSRNILTWPYNTK